MDVAINERSLSSTWYIYIFSAIFSISFPYNMCDPAPSPIRICFLFIFRDRYRDGILNGNWCTPFSGVHFSCVAFGFDVYGGWSESARASTRVIHKLFALSWMGLLLVCDLLLWCFRYATARVFWEWCKSVFGIKWVNVRLFR